MPVTMKIIAYYRVSTKKQEVSGLGLEAQRHSVEDFAVRNSGKIIAEYTEVETGKKADRPKLLEAISHAKLAKATLVVAKLDRLSRNVAFTSALMESGVDFVAVDNPHATKLTIHILAAVAENEAVQTSRRTKDSLAAAKARGVQLGSARPGHWEGNEHLRGWKQGAKNSAKVRSMRARSAYAFLLPIMQKMEAEADAVRSRLGAELSSKVADIEREYADSIAKAQSRLDKATGDKIQAAMDALTEVQAARESAIKAARSEANYPVYEKIADHLNSLGHQTTQGKPFSATAVWRVLSRAKKEGVKV